MGISPEKSKSSAAALGQPAILKILHCKILFHGSFFLAMLACLISLPALSVAQEERPQITPAERPVTRKKDAGPRALAVLQLTASGKASLVPVTILVNGHFYDATAYKANPIPMALDTGTVYEAERTGNSFGLFTVDSALHTNAVNAQAPWLGTGKWAPFGAEDPTKTLKAEGPPVGIDTSEGPPRLSRNPAAASSTPVSPTPPAGAAPPASTPPSSGGSASGDGPPRLTQGSTPPSAPSAGSTPANSSPPVGKSDPPAAAPESKPSAPESDSGASEGNRPRLRRGKPVDPLPEEEIPGYSKPGAAPTTAPNAGKVVEAAATGPLQLIPAISDASGPQPHSYTFVWLKEEEGERRQQMLAYAKEQIRTYVDARAKAMITSKPSPARRSSSGKGPEPVVENVQMIAYDLWVNNQPVLVFAADAHMPPPAANSGLQYTIMIVARTDIYNNLHALYVGVTDKNHLDVTPRLELIDAVDADGDGRGELLFRKTSDVATGWIIYRVTADKIWKLFDSLNPE